MLRNFCYRCWYIILIRKWRRLLNARWFNDNDIWKQGKSLFINSEATTPAMSTNFQFSKIKLMLGRGLVSQSWKEASKKQICVRKVKKTSRNLRNIGSRLSSRFWFIIVPTVTTRYCFLCHAETRFSCEFVYKELPCGNDVKRHICIHMWRDLFWVITFNIDVIKTQIVRCWSITFGAWGPSA